MLRSILSPPWCPGTKDRRTWGPQCWMSQPGGVDGPTLDAKTFAANARARLS
jgi:hypothetical protein